MDQKLGTGIFAIIGVPCRYDACITILSISWEVNKPIYGWVYNWKYSQILGCHNNYILMNVLDDVTDV